jgi:hypothetical protein
MGGDGLDERVFATLEEVHKHGGEQWWLYASTCQVCGQSWMIAQDERVHDNFYLKRLTREGLRLLLDGHWSDDFLTYEQVLRLGVEAGRTCRFLDPLDSSLVWTVEDLRRQRPAITADEIAYLLAVPVDLADKLIERAS